MFYQGSYSIFQCLPIFLPQSFFKQLDKIILSFIWAGKTPRTKYSILQRQKRKAVSRSLIFWHTIGQPTLKKINIWHNSPFIGWCQMESSSCDSTSLSALICAPLNSNAGIYISNPLVLSTVKLWRQFRHH